jgi:hypothetical protein
VTLDRVRCGAASGDRPRCPGDGAESGAVFLVVVGAVGSSRSGLCRCRPGLPLGRACSSTSRISRVTRLRLPPASVAASGMPLASTSRSCFGVQAAAIDQEDSSQGLERERGHGPRPRQRATSRSLPHGSVSETDADGTRLTRPPVAKTAGAASRLPRTHRRTHTAGLPSRSRWAARARSVEREPPWIAPTPPPDRD